MDSSELHKYLNEHFEPLSVRAFRERTKSYMEKYIRESQRLVNYKDFEGFDEDFEKSLLSSILNEQHDVGYVRGSFMEFAEPFEGMMREAIKSIRSKLDSLKILQTEKTVTDIQLANEYLELIEKALNDYNHTPLFKLKDGSHGVDMLSKIWSDIHSLHLFLGDVLKRSG